jgi:hypothetical protein
MVERPRQWRDKRQRHPDLWPVPAGIQSHAALVVPPGACGRLERRSEIFEPPRRRLRLQGFEEGFRLVEAGQQFLGFVLREQFAFPERYSGLDHPLG